MDYFKPENTQLPMITVLGNLSNSTSEDVKIASDDWKETVDEKYQNLIEAEIKEKTKDE